MPKPPNYSRGTAMPKKFWSNEMEEAPENAALFAKDRAAGVRGNMQWYKTSGKSPAELSLQLGLNPVDGNVGNASKFAQAVFREFVATGVLELENGRYYLPGHKPSDRQGQPQDYGRRIAPPKVYYDPSVIDERFAKKREAELKNEGFRLQNLTKEGRAAEERRKQGKKWGVPA
jgi:hypothetical protein